MSNIQEELHSFCYIVLPTTLPSTFQFLGCQEQGIMSMEELHLSSYSQHQQIEDSPQPHCKNVRQLLEQK